MRLFRRRGFSPTFELLEDRLTPAAFLVTNSSDSLPGSLRDAINQANQDPGSTVSIMPQVTQPIVLTSGELSILENMTITNESGARVEVRQTTPGARVVHISGSTALDVTLSGGSALQPLVITGGSVLGANGGGILQEVDASQLTLNFVQVVSNTALRTGTSTDPVDGIGGGIYTQGSVTLNSSSVDGNRGDAGGGGIAINLGDVILTAASQVIGNKAPRGTGGGIAVATGSVALSGFSRVDGNSAKDVGGIMVGTVVSAGDVGVSVTGGSTVNKNKSTAGQHQSPKNLGGGGIAVVGLGDIVIDDGQVIGNQTVGMYSGGIVVGIGDVTVTNGSQVMNNSNNGPGGGIAANFGSLVTVSGGSQVKYNTGSALGGGIVNFSGPEGGVTISGGSQVNRNTLTNGESIGRAIATFLEVVHSNTSFNDFAEAVGGAGGAAMTASLQQLDQMKQQAAGALQDAVQNIGHPLGVLVAGGGIASLITPVSITEGSKVNHNLSGKNVRGANHGVIGLAGGIFQVLGDVTINHGRVDGNQAHHGDGGGIWNGGTLSIVSSTMSGNLADGSGGGIFNQVNGAASVQTSTVDGNTASSGGGLTTAGRLTVSQSLIAKNLATKKRGGGIFCDGGTLTLIDAVLANNQPNDMWGCKGS